MRVLMMQEQLDDQQQSEQHIEAQLRQNMLRSHPVPQSQAASRVVSPLAYESAAAVRCFQDFGNTCCFRSIALRSEKQSSSLALTSAAVVKLYLHAVHCPATVLLTLQSHHNQGFQVLCTLTV